MSKYHENISPVFCYVNITHKGERLFFFLLPKSFITTNIARNPAP